MIRIWISRLSRSEYESKWLNHRRSKCLNLRGFGGWVGFGMFTRNVNSRCCKLFFWRVFGRWVGLGLVLVGLPGNVTFDLRDGHLGLGEASFEARVIISVRVMCE